MNDYLAHYGTPHVGMTPHSGRYKYGSGENGFQRAEDFLDYCNKLRDEGKSETDIAKLIELSTTELRQQKSLAKAEKVAAEEARAVRLHNHGVSNSEAARKMGIPEATFRQRLKKAEDHKENVTQKTAEVLEKELKKKKYLDVGSGTEVDLGVSDARLGTALKVLKDKGYTVETIWVEQAGNPGKYTTVKVLAPAGTTKADLLQNKDKIKTLGDNYSRDNGLTYSTLKKPQSIDSSRVKINYAETGGKEKDGVIEIRKGVEDLSLGNSQYAQVRIAVDGTHYLKGMAMYSDNIPKGYDIVFNTNKSQDVAKMDVLKKMKKDPDNPFGALIKESTEITSKDNGKEVKLLAGGQNEYIGKDGKKHLSAINKVKEEGDWTKWSKTIASQFLSKQSLALAKQQLTVSYKEKKAEYDEINSLTNPVIKQKLLESFADDCDSSSVHLKAAALPRQNWQVILPVPSLKDNEVYAPNYRNGEQVALVRYPHGGTFEIPLVRVNNRNKQAQSVMKNAQDAIGINTKVAERLSGADFDGDTVLVIPTANSQIKSTPALQGLKNFDPSEAYPGYKGMKVLKGQGKQNEMGRVSNLITDITLIGQDRGIPRKELEADLARAVRHSMVVIDAEKHELNYRQSAKDNGIAALKKKYQAKGGASTLISGAKKEVRIPERRQYYHTDSKTGEKIYELTGATYKDKDGKIVKRQSTITQMEKVQDARELSSGTRMEALYASYANRLKSMANQARKDAVNIKDFKYSPSAHETYAQEVKNLDSKLNVALKNAPKERQAQLLANAIYEKKLNQMPELKDKAHKDDRKKIKTQALATARAQTGAISRKNRKINITDREWEAIQSHAITKSKLEKIINNTDMDDLKERAMPRGNQLSASKEALIKALLGRYPQSEIAERAGVSVSTVAKVANA